MLESRNEPCGRKAPAVCDACGGSSTYSEAITTDGSYQKRTITASGCPNHYNYCTGKGPTDTCGALGAEGAGTEALVQDYSWDIPANPVIATSITTTSVTDASTTVECTTASIAIALNGVPIYGGSVSGSCDILDCGSH